MVTPEHVAHLRREDERLDRRLRQRSAKWSEIEKDDTRGGALPEHLEAQRERAPGVSTEQAVLFRSSVSCPFRGVRAEAENAS